MSSGQVFISKVVADGGINCALWDIVHHLHLPSKWSLPVRWACYIIRSHSWFFRACAWIVAWISACVLTCYTCISSRQLTEVLDTVFICWRAVIAALLYNQSSDTSLSLLLKYQSTLFLLPETPGSGVLGPLSNLAFCRQCGPMNFIQLLPEELLAGHCSAEHSSEAAGEAGMLPLLVQGAYAANDICMYVLHYRNK